MNGSVILGFFIFMELVGLITIVGIIILVVKIKKKKQTKEFQCQTIVASDPSENQSYSAPIDELGRDHYEYDEDDSNSGEYKLLFKSIVNAGRWKIEDENKNCVLVAEMPMNLVKRTCIDIYDGRKEKIVGRITDPINSPLGYKDTFRWEVNGEDCGTAVCSKMLSTITITSRELDLTLRIKHRKSEIYKGGQLIAIGDRPFLKRNTEITYWDKSCLTQIVLIYFTFMLLGYKE